MIEETKTKIDVTDLFVLEEPKNTDTPMTTSEVRLIEEIPKVEKW